MKLHLLCGIPGCGKSTLAKSLPGYLISSDQLRKCLWGAETVFNYNKLIFNLMEVIVTYMLSTKQDVIVDSTNITKKSRKKFIDIAKDYRAEVIVHWVDCPIEIAIEQNSKRERQVPIVVIRSMAKSLQPPTTEEGIQVVMVYKPDLTTLGQF